MYSLDGVALQNATYGWRLKLGTNPWTGIGRQLADFNASGRDGTVQVRGLTTTPTLTLAVTSPRVNLGLLRQLLRLGSSLQALDDSTRQATVELVSATPEVVSPAADIHRVTAVFRLPAVSWRDVATTDWGPFTLAGSGAKATVLTGSTAPVRDALVSVAGPVTGLAVVASGGTYFSYPPAVSAGSWLTFDSKTGRAWTGSAAFAQTTEVTGQVGNGPGPYFLECAGTSNPAQLGTPLTVTWTGGTPQLTVRGRNAYDQ